MKMESEYACLWNYGNDAQLQSAWLNFQSKLSDLEEKTESLMSFINQENGESFSERTETGYQKNSELEKQIVKYHQIYRHLLDHHNPVFGRSSISSFSTVNNFTKSHEIESSNSNPDSCVEDVDLESPKLRELCEKNIPKLSETCEKNLPKSSETGQEKIQIDFLERLVGFEKRLSCSEEVVEDNKRYVDELTRRYEEKNRANKMLKEQIGLLMKEVELLQTENLMLSEKRRLKFCSVKRMKGLVKRKISIKWLKDLLRKINFNRMKDLVKRKINNKGLTVLVKRKISIIRLKVLAKRNNSIKRLKGLVSMLEKQMTEVYISACY